MLNTNIKYAKLTKPAFIRDSVVDGLGIRLYIGFQGCLHNCRGCFNDSAHDINEGQLVEISTIKAEILKQSEHIDGITFSGGDSLLQPEAVYIISEYAHSLGLDVWLYTGYTWEQIVQDTRKLQAAKNADIIVDGPFIEPLKDLSLPFKGSSNQRIIDVVSTINSNQISLLRL